jgi:hypothetical protein
VRFARFTDPGRRPHRAAGDTRKVVDLPVGRRGCGDEPADLPIKIAGAQQKLAR